MKKCIEELVYQVLNDVYKYILNADLEEKRNLAMMYFSEIINDFANLFEILKLDKEKIKEAIRFIELLEGVKNEEVGDSRRFSLK